MRRVWWFVWLLGVSACVIPDDAPVASTVASDVSTVGCTSFRALNFTKGGIVVTSTQRSIDASGGGTYDITFENLTRGWYAGEVVTETGSTCLPPLLGTPASFATGTGELIALGPDSRYTLRNVYLQPNQPLVYCFTGLHDEHDQLTRHLWVPLAIGTDFATQFLIGESVTQLFLKNAGSESPGDVIAENIGLIASTGTELAVALNDDNPIAILGITNAIRDLILADNLGDRIEAIEALFATSVEEWGPQLLARTNMRVADLQTLSEGLGWLQHVMGIWNVTEMFIDLLFAYGEYPYTAVAVKVVDQGMDRDMMPPDGRILAPLEGAQVGSHIVVRGDASDECRGVARVNLTYSLDNGTTWRFAGSDTTAPYEIPLDLSAAAPNAPIRLGWDIYDNAGQFANSPHGNVTVTRSAAVPAATLAASIVSLPPRITTSPSQVVRFTWRVQNVGTSAWTSADSIVLGGGSTVTWIAGQVPPLGPSATGDITLDVRVPATTGDQVGYAQLSHGGVAFGPVLPFSWYAGTPPPPPCPSGVTCADGSCASTQLPTGGSVARVAGTEELWAIAGDRRHQIAGPCSTVFAERVAAARCVTSSAIATLAAAPPPCTEGSFVRPVTGPRVYRREGGRLRALCGAWNASNFQTTYGSGFEIVLPITTTELARLEGQSPVLVDGIYPTGSAAPACGQPGLECGVHDDPDDVCWGQRQCPTCSSGDVCSNGTCVAEPDPTYESDTIQPAGFVQVPGGPLVGGAAVALSWYAEDATGIASGRIEYTLDGWVTAYPAHAGDLLAGAYANTIQNPTGVVAWTVPNAATERAGVRLVIADLAGNFRVVYAPNFVIGSGASTTTCPEPAAPLLFDPGLLSPSGAYPLTWQDVVGATGYQVEESLDATFSSPTDGASIVDPSYAIAGRIDGQYYYRVRAETRCGTSPWSNVVDITVDRNAPPDRPASPSPADGASDIDRSVVLTWTGGDDGTVEYAVRLGFDRAAMPFVRAYAPAASAAFDLAAGAQYHWQVVARDEEGAITEGPVWTFTTSNQLADVAIERIVTTGAIAPGAAVTAAIEVANRGTRGSLPGPLGVYLGRAPGDRDQLLVRLDVPALAPGETRTLTTPVTLDGLGAGDSYASALLEPEASFEDAIADNNEASTLLHYTDGVTPSLAMLELRHGTGPARDRFQAGHEYSLVYDARDDVGVTSLELAFQANGDPTWRPIATLAGQTLAQGASLITWQLPAGTPLGSATLRGVAHDGSGNSTTRTYAFTVIDGALPVIAMVSHVDAQPVSLGQTSQIEWSVSTTHGLGQIVIYLHYGDRIDTVVSLPSPSASTYAWAVPNSASYVTTNARLRVRAIDLLGNESESWSTPFQIVDDSTPPPEPWGVPTVVTNVGACGQPFCLQHDHDRVALAVDSAGVAHAAYSRTHIDMRDGTSGSYYVQIELLYRKSTGAGWTAEEPIVTYPLQVVPSTADAMHVDEVTIDTDANGDPHVMWAYKQMNAFVGDVFAARRTTSWEAATNLSSNPTYSHLPRIAVGTDGQVHALWRDGSPARLLHHRQRSVGGGAWSAVSTTAAGLGLLDVSPGPGGTIVAAYTANGTLTTTTLSSAGWSAPVTAMTCPSTGPNAISIAVRPDAANAVTTAYFDDGAGTLGYGAGCPTLVRWDGNTISNAIVRWDSRELPLLAWRSDGTKSGIFFRRGLADEAWSNAVRLSPASQFPQQQLAFDVHGTTAHVAYIAYVSGRGEVIHTTADLATDIYAPSVTIAPLPATVGAGAAVGLAWSAEDDTNVATIELSYTRDGGLTFQPIATLPGTSTAHAWIAPTATGPVRIRVIAIDAAGNRGAAESLDAAIEDLVAPTVAIIAPTSGATVAVGVDIAISWTASDDLGVTRVDVVLVTPGGAAPIISNLTSETAIVWRPGDDCAGCTLRVDVSDAAGHLTSAAIPVSVVWANRAPVTPFGESPHNAAIGVSPDLVELRWNSADADGDAVRYDVIVDGVAVAANTTATSVTILDRAPNTSVTWHVVATDGVATTVGPTWQFTTGLVYPPAPAAASILETRSDRVSIVWTPSAPSDSTCIERRTTGAFAQIAELAAGVTRFDDFEVTGNTAYTYRVCARRDGVTSPYSAELAAETANSSPRIPEAITPPRFSTVAPGSVELTWSGGDPDPGAVVTYRVLFGETELIEVAAGLVEARHTIGALAPSTLYSWRVVAEDERGASVASATFSFATESPPGLMSPDGLSGEVRQHTLVVLAWMGVSDAEGYVVERNGGTSWNTVAEVVAPTYADPAPTPEGDYRYRVRARRGTQVSAPSSEVAVDTRNRAPSFTSTLPTTVAVGETYAHDLAASDPDGDEVSFALGTGPAGMSVTGSRVVWQPTANDMGTHAVALVASDALGGSTTYTLELAVTEGDAPPSDGGGCCGASRSPSGLVFALLVAWRLRRRRPRGHAP